MSWSINTCLSLVEVCFARALSMLRTRDHPRVNVLVAQHHAVALREREIDGCTTNDALSIIGLTAGVVSFLFLFLPRFTTVRINLVARLWFKKKAHPAYAWSTLRTKHFSFSRSKKKTKKKNPQRIRQELASPTELKAFTDSIRFWPCTPPHPSRHKVGSADWLAAAVRSCHPRNNHSIRGNLLAIFTIPLRLPYCISFTLPLPSSLKTGLQP